MLPNMKKSWLIIALLMCAIVSMSHRVYAGACQRITFARWPENPPLARIVEDQTPPFTLDPSTPFLLSLGRGDGKMELNTISINEQGTVTLYSLRVERCDGVWNTFWETGTLHLSRDDVKAILDTVHTQHLMSLHTQYHADVYDGTQWILWLTQAPHEKSIYCHNYFPEEIVAFSDFVDDLLLKRGLPDILWTQIPDDEAGVHDDALWQSIR